MAELSKRATRSKDETLAIPQGMRDEVDARDKGYCRVCGKYLGPERAIHHIIFGGDERGMGGRRVHVVTEMISVCWMFGEGGRLPCHDLVHAEKRRFQQLLLELAGGKYPGRSAFQIERWAARAARLAATRRERHERLNP